MSLRIKYVFFSGMDIDQFDISLIFGDVATVLVIIGFILFAISFFGSCGACCDIKCMLLMVGFRCLMYSQTCLQSLQCTCIQLPTLVNVWNFLIWFDSFDINISWFYLIFFSWNSYIHTFRQNTNGGMNHLQQELWLILKSILVLTWNEVRFLKYQF